jgi:hypothetical protein
VNHSTVFKGMEDDEVSDDETRHQVVEVPPPNYESGVKGKLALKL